MTDATETAPVPPTEAPSKIIVPESAAEPAAPPPKPPYILRQTVYVNEKDHTVEHYEVVEGSAPPEVPRYVGRTLITMGSGPNAQHMPMSFPIQAETVAEAFSKWTAEAEAEGERVKEEVKKMIRSAHAQQKSQLLLPGGRQPMPLRGPSRGP